LFGAGFFMSKQQTANSKQPNSGFDAQSPFNEQGGLAVCRSLFAVRYSAN
jgi:hypothetical protein